MKEIEYNKLTPAQTTILAQIKQFIDLCNRLERKNPGLTEYLLQSKFAASYRENERRIEELFDTDSVEDIVMLMGNIRNDWLICLNEFIKKEKGILL